MLVNAPDLRYEDPDACRVVLRHAALYSYTETYEAFDSYTETYESYTQSVRQLTASESS